MEKCPKYANGKAKEEFFLRNKVVFCHAKFCPYNKELVTSFEGEKIVLCKSKGLLEKIELDNPDKNKKTNNPQILPEYSKIGDISKVRYFQFSPL